MPCPTAYLQQIPTSLKGSFRRDTVICVFRYIVPWTVSFYGKLNIFSFIASVHKTTEYPADCISSNEPLDSSITSSTWLWSSCQRTRLQFRRSKLESRCYRPSVALFPFKLLYEKYCQIQVESMLAHFYLHENIKILFLLN